MWKRYISATPANIARLLIAIKTILVSIAGAELFIGSPKIGFWILLSTGVLNELASFINTKNNDSKNE